MIFNPTRDQARQFFIDAWHKHRERGAAGVLTPIEHRVVEIMQIHPEYHALLEDPERALARDFPPERGETNPFLHLSLHLAVEEQLAIDRPPGIASAYRFLVAELGTSTRPGMWSSNALARPSGRRSATPRPRKAPPTCNASNGGSASPRPDCVAVEEAW